MGHDPERIRYVAVMPTPSLIPASLYASQAVKDFRAACEHLFSGDLAGAERLISNLDDIVLRQHYFLAQQECGRRLENLSPQPVSKVADREAQRMPDASLQKTIFDRDGWRCRWCTTPVIHPAANRRMTAEFPDLYPGGPKNTSYHGLILSSQGSIDHVLPHSLGGTNDENNLVAACWPCQFARGEIDFTVLNLDDPRDREPIIDTWDGCQWFTK